MKVKSESEVAQSCPTLSDPMDCSLLSSSVHEIFQARVLEWGAITFSENLCIAPPQKKTHNDAEYALRQQNTEHERTGISKMTNTPMVVAQTLSRVRLCATLWTAACQAPLSLGISGKAYWSGLPFPPPGKHPPTHIQTKI